MAIIKKFASFQNLSNFQVFEIDKEPNSAYFRITELESTLTGGKNGFLIEGSEYLKETTEVKIEILDVEGNPIYFEPGNGIPEYYEGNSKLIAVHVYDDTPIGIGKITVLGELKKYIANDGSILPVPQEWAGIYNVKWEQEFKINKNLSNENIVRFYKRPLVSISELVKPIFTKTIPSVTKTGYVHGIAETPPLGTNINNWRAGTNYKLKLTSGSWDRDVDENTITISSLNYSPKIIEVINDTEVLVDIPYSSNNIVSNFTSGSYSITYSDFNNETIGETSLTGSFAKIDISNLKTFVGDVARVKVFRKSRNAIGDFQFVQESKLESSELLRDITTQNDTELSYGRFDETNLSTYWETSSIQHPISIDSSVLSQAVKFDYNNSVGGVQQLITSESISISNDVEYTLNFKTLLSGSLTTNKSIRAFFSSSNFTQDFLTISGSSIYTTRQNISKNIISQNTGDAKLVFEVQGDDWYISNASLKNAQETSFSPDEFTLIQDIPRKTASETFDFRFEFYDINNNYIPVVITAVGVFDGGNDFPTSGKLLTFESDRNAFRFSSGSIQNPINQQIQFKIGISNLTGSTTFASSAFDVDGNYLNPSDYTQYPGKLTTITPAGAIITINNFTGSRTDSSETPFVGSIVYTASLENLQEFETVYRLEDGDNAPQLIVTSNANQFIYEPTTLSPKPSGQSITVRAQRKNLASLITPIEVNSGSNTPPLNFVETVNGIDSYTISATQFSQSFSANNFEEVTYSFTGSDVFGNSQSDEITLSKVVNFDAVSLVLSNESTAFPANSTGEILGGFDSSVGSVQMFIGGTQIQHSDGLSTRNRFDIISSSGDNVTPTDDTPNTSNYSISAFQTSKESGSLTLDIEYLAGDNTTSQSFQKVVSYTKSKKAVPNVLTKTSPTSQTINSGSSGYEVPQTIEVVVQEGGDEYSYQAGLSGGLSEAYKFEINSVSSGSNSNEIITPTYGTHAGYNGTIGSASIDYVNSEGTLVENKLVRFDVSVSKIGVDGKNARQVSLLISPNSISYNADGTNPTPSTVTLIASSSNIDNPNYKFSGGDSSFVDDTTFIDASGSDGNTSRVFTAPLTIPSTSFNFRVGVSDEGADVNTEITNDREALIFVKPGLDTRPRFIIKPLNGTQIKNNQGTLELQVVRLDGTGSFDISGSAQGDAQLYSGSTLLTTSMTGISDGGNGVTYNASFDNTSISGSKLISLKEDDGTLLDTIALLDVTDGLGGGTFLANSLHTNRGITNSFTPTTLPVTASFFDSNGTEFQKSALITPSFNGTVDKMKISTATGASEITLTANDGDGGSITLGSVTATTTKDLTVNATFVDPNTSKTTSVSETFFIVSDGRDGTNARSVRLTNDAQVFVEALDGTVTPSSISFTAIRQNISGSSTFNTDPSVTLTGTGDSRALSATNFGSNTSVVLSVTASEDGDFTDEVRIVRVKEGTDGLTLISSNPAHTLPASSSGEVLDYANSGTTLSLFEGATQLDYDNSGTTAGHWTVATSQLPASTITVGTITDSTNDAVVDVHSAMVNGTDTVAITYTITGKRLNGDAISLTSVQTLTKSKEGLDSIQVSNDNSNHTFTCDTAGTPTSFAGSGTNIQVFEGVTALTFTTGTVSAGKYSIAISNESGLTEGTASGNNTTTCVIGNHSAFTANQATITYTISGQRLDGQAFTLTTTQTLTKSIPVTGKVALSPTSLRVSDSLDSTPFDSSPGTTGTPTISNTHYGLYNSSATAITTNTDFDNIGYVGLGASLTSDNNFSTDMKVYCQRTLEVGDVVVLYQDATNYGNYTLEAKTNADGSGDTVLKLTYISSAGTLTVQSLDYIGFGRELVGPGVVYRGEYDSGTTYYYTETRRDIVEYSSTYYLASNPTDSGTSNWGTPGSSTDWEEFGAEFSSIATNVLFAQDVYANRTINIGSSAGNPVIALNSDFGNSNENPSIAIGAATYDGTGIFLGYDGGTPKASLKSTSGHLKWNGSTLDIKGDITITNTSEFAPIGAEANPSNYDFGPDASFDLNTVGTPTNNGLYLGSDKLGFYNGGWKTYMDNSGNFYLGGTSGALTWNGTTLSITGDISISNPGDIDISDINNDSGFTNDDAADAAQSTANTATGSAAAAQATANTANTNANNALAGVTAINDTTSSLENPTTFTPTSNANTSNGLHLGSNRMGYYNGGWKTYMDDDGNFYLGGDSNGALSWNNSTDELVITGSIFAENGIFSGVVSGSSIQGGTMEIGDGFLVSAEGSMTASGASISGSFNIEGGKLGSWVVESPSAGGRLRNEYDESAPGTGSLVFEPTIPEIQGYKVDGNNVDKKVSIHPENTWVSTQGGNLSTSITNNNGGGGGTWSLPANSTSSGTTNSSQYNSTDQSLAGIIGGVGTATSFVVAQDGTYEITGLANLSSITMSTPSTISGTLTTGYPSYTGGYTGATHVPTVIAKRHVYEIYLIFKNTSTNAETTVSVQSITSRGATQVSGYQWNGSMWSGYNSTGAATTASTSYASVAKTVGLSAGTYNAFYRIRNGAASGYVQQVEQGSGMPNGSLYPAVYTTTSNNVSAVGYNGISFTLVIPSNLVELSSKGLQILNDTTNYFQVQRLDSVSGTPVMMTMKGGQFLISPKTVTGAYGTQTLLDVDGKTDTVGLNVSYAYGASNTVGSGLNYHLVPRYDNGVDLGTSNFRYDDIYATNGTIQTSDRNEKENISGSVLGLNFINDLRPVKYNFISGSRTHYGLISQEVSESLASSSIHTTDFAGFIQTDLYNSGSDEGVPKKEILNNENKFGTLNDWTYSSSKYGIRYTEFIAPMIKAIQELSNKVTQLENQISGSL